VLLSIFHAGEGLFQTGWFVESMVTQTLVVFCIRTRRLFFRSKPGEFLTLMNIGAVALAIVLPFLPFCGVWFGFVALPPLFFVYLVIATLVYLGLVELTKYVFYRYVAGPSSQATT
jgi:Mg2+-importing ATPase